MSAHDSYAKEDDLFKKEREAMVASQIERRGVKDERVLEAMRTVPRHLFVPVDQKQFAYEDYPLPIGYRQTISQPSFCRANWMVSAIAGSSSTMRILGFAISFTLRFDERDQP